MNKREERRARTIRLLETRTAWFPQVRSQFSTFGALPGEAPTKRVPCKSCSSSGVVNGRQGPEECKGCAGKGSYLVDGYTGQREREKRVEGSLSGSERSRRGKQIDAELGRLSLQLASPSEVSSRSLADEQPEGWERERDRHYRAGDYRRLDLALDWLGDLSPLSRQLVEWCYEFQVVRLGTATRALVLASELAVDLAATQMPDPIRVPHWHLNTDGAEAYRKRRTAA